MVILLITVIVPTIFNLFECARQMEFKFILKKKKEREENLKKIKKFFFSTAAAAQQYPTTHICTDCDGVVDVDDFTKY